VTDEEFAQLDAWVAWSLQEPEYVLLTTRQAAEQTGVAPGTVRSWAARGLLHRWCDDDLGRPLYRESDVLVTLAILRSDTPEDRSVDRPVHDLQH